jgi:hypothetical protein
MIGEVTPEMAMAELNKPAGQFDRNLAGGMMMYALKDSPLRFGHMEKVFNLPDNEFKEVNKKYINALVVGGTSI